jgi:hypothetical protein
MKTVAQKINSEIDYLTALAAMCENESDQEARAAALEAIDALRRLRGVLARSCESPEKLPLAA